MPDVNVKSRIISKHNVESYWDDNPTFVPKQGEFIVYDIDENHSYERLKIGNGTDPISELPFSDGHLLEQMTLLQEQIDQNILQVGSTQPSFACTWFNVKSETTV